MSTETLALIILIALVLGAFPMWPYASSWGYIPSGALSLVLIIFLVWAIAGERPLFRTSTHSNVTSTQEDIKAAGKEAGRDIQSAGNEIGRDLKAAGRDVAESIRNTLQ
jgi:hypothetical protein